MTVNSIFFFILGNYIGDFTFLERFKKNPYLCISDNKPVAGRIIYTNYTVNSTDVQKPLLYLKKDTVMRKLNNDPCISRNKIMWEGGGSLTNLLFLADQVPRLHQC